MTYELKQYSLGDSENEVSRPSRGKMSCKLEEACTSRIVATCNSDGSIHVRYISYHTGHDPSSINEIRHLSLSPFIRRQIMLQLLDKVDEKAIVRSMNQSLRDRNNREIAIMVQCLALFWAFIFIRILLIVI